MSVLANKIGEMLLKGNLITADQLRGALETQEKTHERIGTVLVKAGFINEEELLSFLGRQFNLPVVDLSKYEINPEVVRLLPEEMVQKHLALPINRVGSKVIVAVADPSNMAIVDGIGFKTGYSVELVLASERAITAEINKFFDRSMEFKDIISELDEDLEVIHEEAVETADLERAVDDAPVVKLANYLLTEAIKRRASDIHIEPYEKEFRVRYRIDGVLYEVMRPPLKLRNALSSRLKIMASLDIAERRLPQDGRIKMKIGKGREMDFRVSVLPTIYGEKIVLRLLDKSNLQLDMTKLGFEEKQLKDFKTAIHQPFGMVLVTGPTGSGKTTTLYTALNALNTAERKTFTVEDPIEYQLVGVNQVQVLPKIGLTFATALRSMLRQDPDIIMVGEIRDLETAQMSIQASLTGHLVLSTVHTNSAAATVTRLLDMGVADYLLSSTLTGVLAQRLVRRLCGSCSATAEASPLLLDKLRQGSAGAAPRTAKDLKGLRRKMGCPSCRHTGFLGRTTISELLVVTDAVRERMLESGTEAAVHGAALDSGMITMFDDGLAKALRGETTIEEVLRVTRMG
jgi:type IV pilus assembly protein PilB